MDIDKLVRDLESVKKKYENNRTFTGQLNISNLCEDAIRGLKQQQEKLDEYADALVSITKKIHSIVELLNKAE